MIGSPSNFAADFHLIEATAGGVLYKKGVFKNFANFTGKHVLEFLFIKVAWSVILLKRGSNTDVFL